MKKRVIVLMMVLTLSISLSACGGNKPISSNNSGKDKTEESEQEIQTEDDTKDNAERGGEIDPDNPPVNWGTPDGPEMAVKNYYANTVFELVSFEIAQASKEHVIFTITSKKDGILVEPNRTIELSYEDGKWKVINEGY